MFQACQGVLAAAETREGYSDEEEPKHQVLVVVAEAAAKDVETAQVFGPFLDAHTHAD